MRGDPKLPPVSCQLYLDLRAFDAVVLNRCRSLLILFTRIVVRDVRVHRPQSTRDMQQDSPATETGMLTPRSTLSDQREWGPPRAS